MKGNKKDKDKGIKRELKNDIIKILNSHLAVLWGPLMSLKMSSIKKFQIYENNGNGQRLSGGLRYIICLDWTFCKIVLFYTFFPRKVALTFIFA